MFVLGIAPGVGNNRGNAFPSKDEFGAAALEAYPSFDMCDVTLSSGW